LCSVQTKNASSEDEALPFCIAVFMMPLASGLVLATGSAACNGTFGMMSKLGIVKKARVCPRAAAMLEDPTVVESEDLQEVLAENTAYADIHGRAGCR
jgi:hypothetical protein